MLDIFEKSNMSDSDNNNLCINLINITSAFQCKEYFRNEETFVLAKWKLALSFMCVKLQAYSSPYWKVIISIMIPILPFVIRLEGSVLIFVTRKANSEELATNLKARDFKGEC